MQDILKTIMTQLEWFAEQNVSIKTAMDRIEATAKSYEELLVINVVRETCTEISQEEQLLKSA